MALLTGDVPPFPATGSSNFPRAYQLVGRHQDNAAAAPAPFSWSTLGSTSPFPIPSPWSTPGSQLCSGQPTRFSAGNKEGHYLCYKPSAGEPGPRGGNPAVAPARRAPQGIPAETCFSSTLSTPALFGYTTLAILKNSSAASRAMSRSCQSNRVLQSAWAAWSGSPLCGSQVKPGLRSNLLPPH